MNKEDYKKYQESVAKFFEREGLYNLSIIYTNNVEPEAYFSHSPCHCCQRHLGGDRHDCHGYNRTTKEVQGGYEVCMDCVYFNEYGQLDDQTMLDMEEETVNQSLGETNV